MRPIRMLPGFEVPRIATPKKPHLIDNPVMTWEEHSAIVERYRKTIQRMQTELDLYRSSNVLPEDVLLRLALLDAHPVPMARLKRHKGAGYIYVIQEEKGLTCKIGKSVNFVNRGQTFKVKLPFKWHTVALFLFDDYHKRERKFHEMFDAKRAEGEWFNLNAGDIVTLWNSPLCMARWFGEFRTQDGAHHYALNLPDDNERDIVSAA